MVAGVVVRPTQVVEQRPGPICRLGSTFAELQPALRPLFGRFDVVDGDRAHMERVTGEEVLTVVQGTGEGRLEERKRRGRIAARTQLSTALEVDPHLCNPARSRERLGFLEQALTWVEVVAQAFHARELRQNLRAALVRRFTVELLAQTALASLGVVEVPERPQAIHQASIGT